MQLMFSICLEVEPSQGSGLQFRASIRSGDGPRTHGLMKKSHTAPVAKQVVLVIDDDPAARGSLKFSLEAQGFAVRAYAGAYELLNETDLPVNSCLVIDYYMPAMSGLELLARLRDRGVSIPAIVITSYPNCKLRERMAAAGVLFVENPLLANVLVDRIREVLARRQS
jgi:two-component system, LuxR family, response regulator FixJ